MLSATCYTAVVSAIAFCSVMLRLSGEFSEYF